MFREFISIFQSGDSLQRVSEKFTNMLTITGDMAVAAGRIYFDGNTDPAALQEIREQDVKVNRLERRIRKLIVAHLSIRHDSVDLPYCLYLMSLAKDVERLGDYAKNLSELVEIAGGAPPDDERAAELQAIRVSVEQMYRDAATATSGGDEALALRSIQQGHQLTMRCEALLRKIAAADYPPQTAVALALGTRYYKRFSGHLINIFSSVIMPLHKLDFFDEDEIDQKLD